MIVLIEPVSENIGMYVPAFPLPLMEIAGFVQANEPDQEIRIISLPADYGLPLSRQGKHQIYDELMSDLVQLNPKGVGISCTAISQARETVELCERIKATRPDIVTFLGGYFPTIYYEEIFSMTSSVDVIVTGEGEPACLELIRAIQKDADLEALEAPNLLKKGNRGIRRSTIGARFDLKQKAPLQPELIQSWDAYDILPYAFSRGCHFRCNFCMEDYIRPDRKTVPVDMIKKDLRTLLAYSTSRTLLISDALFKSYDLFPYLRSLDLKIIFETRCDVLAPALIPEFADICSIMALGFESASYNTLRRMNKVKNRPHYEKYLENMKNIFKEATRYGIPLTIFMIAGYPGDTEKDLNESLTFARQLADLGGDGGHVFKIGECHVYPKTKIDRLARSLDDVVFDDDGVFGQNVVRKPSKDLSFEKVLGFMEDVYRLSNPTSKTRQRLLNVMPFFRLPVDAFHDEMIPDVCFNNQERSILDMRGESKSRFKKSVPSLIRKYHTDMSGQRTKRRLSL